MVIVIIGPFTASLLMQPGETPAEYEGSLLAWRQKRWFSKFLRGYLEYPMRRRAGDYDPILGGYRLL